jgi:hypothetical protein
VARFAKFKHVIIGFHASQFTFYNMFFKAKSKPCWQFQYGHCLQKDGLSSLGITHRIGGIIISPILVG